MNMLFLSVLFLLSGPLSAVDYVPTYEYLDPSTKQIVTCEKCPPGTHMSAHCTASMPTQCVPCRSGHFTELWNYLPKCLYCSNFCMGNQEVKTECSPTTNRVCRCKEGFYWDEDFCIRHTECAPGNGVQIKGTQQTDTVCEKCPEGYFSSTSSAVDPCVKHQECASGQSALLTGSEHFDTLCGTCESLANEDEPFRRFLSTFFHMHRMPVVKMKKFVSRYITAGRCNLPKQRGPLLEHISDWLFQAPQEQLRKLPQMLRDSELRSMTNKLKQRLREIKEQNPNCSLTVS